MLTESDDEFFDACGDIERKSDFDQAIEETYRALNFFFDNRFGHAKEFLKLRIGESMYHSIGYSTLLYLEAFMTFEAKAIEAANEALRQTLSICQKLRRKRSFVLLFWSYSRESYEDYTCEERHAELCYAEILLQTAMLKFIQDESWFSFVKGSVNVRSSYNAYLLCEEINEMLKVQDRDFVFETGILLGLGGFNLLFSYLPPTLIKLLDIVGIHGDRNKGNAQLQRAAISSSRSLRGPLSAVTLLAYNLLLLYNFGIGSSKNELAICFSLIEAKLNEHPRSMIFNFFSARHKFIIGFKDESFTQMQFAASLQSEWPHLNNICHWELMWLYFCRLNWKKAYDFADIMLNANKWSRCIYAYAKGIFLFTHITHERISLPKNEATFLLSLKNEIMLIFRQVPVYKQKIAGKSLPMEKFVVKRVERYFAQDDWLPLPAFEFAYLSNMFLIFSKQPPLLRTIIASCDECLKHLVNVNQNSTVLYNSDNEALLHLLKGVCFQHLFLFSQAINQFEKACSMESLVTADCSWIIPFTLVEVAYTHLLMDDLVKYHLFLSRAKVYTGYPLYSRLQIKIHLISTSNREELVKSFHHKEANLSSPSTHINHEEELPTKKDISVPQMNHSIFSSALPDLNTNGISSTMPSSQTHNDFRSTPPFHFTSSSLSCSIISREKVPKSRNKVYPSSILYKALSIPNLKSYCKSIKKKAFSKTFHNF